jgi:Trk K+ transport system NAD-binding subunit
MNSILFLILRRLRKPLILIIVSFAIAIFGLTLMPGVDNQGQPWRMSVFDALYVISYTATTIGFGEIPYPFSQSQRLWTTFSIFLTVIPWFYAIGKIITLLQDTALKQAVEAQRFSRAVQSLQEPFFILCSYGQSASLLAKSLDHMNMRVVVIEASQNRLDELELTDTKQVMPHFCGNAMLPDNLIRAGILNPHCCGLITLTDNDEVNLAIAIAVKLLNPHLPVVARAERDDIAANMASFGTDHIINPYTLFGDQLAMRVHALGNYLLHEWLTGIVGETLLPTVPPPRGHWIVCGYGRFGKSVVANLEREHITTTIVEAKPELTGCKDCIVGSGTEAKTLKEADIDSAVAIVAGTDNDINNLSIVMTAYELNPKIFLVIRKNNSHNKALFKQFDAHITMQPTSIIAHECLAHLISPLLAQFLALARHQSNEWANQVISQLVAKVGEEVPATWAVTINQKIAPAVTQLINQNIAITLKMLTKHPTDRDHDLNVTPLMLVRNTKPTLLPAIDTPLMIGDQILFCGRPETKASVATLLEHEKTLTYIADGTETPNSLVFRWLLAKK